MKHLCECKCGCKLYAAGKVCSKCHYNKDRAAHDRDISHEEYMELIKKNV